MADGGFTPAEIDRFTLADANLLFKRWGEYPTVRAMVAAYLGVKPPPSAEAVQQSVTSIEALRAQFPDGLMRG